jgi:hypothetical protein
MFAHAPGSNVYLAFDGEVENTEAYEEFLPITTRERTLDDGLACACKKGPALIDHSSPRSMHLLSDATPDKSSWHAPASWLSSFDLLTIN